MKSLSLFACSVVLASLVACSADSVTSMETSVRSGPKNSDFGAFSTIGCVAQRPACDRFMFPNVRILFAVTSNLMMSPKHPMDVSRKATTACLMVACGKGRSIPQTAYAVLSRVRRLTGLQQRSERHRRYPPVVVHA